MQAIASSRSNYPMPAAVPIAAPIGTATGSWRAAREFRPRTEPVAEQLHDLLGRDRLVIASVDVLPAGWVPAVAAAVEVAACVRPNGLQHPPGGGRVTTTPLSEVIRVIVLEDILCCRVHLRHRR